MRMRIAPVSTFTSRATGMIGCVQATIVSPNRPSRTMPMSVHSYGPLSSSIGWSVNSVTRAAIWIPKRPCAYRRIIAFGFLMPSPCAYSISLYSAQAILYGSPSKL